MGITLALMKQLKHRGVFSRSGLRVLDIGSSNLYKADAPGVIEFVRAFSGSEPQAQLSAFADRLAKGSAYDPVKGGLNESFAGELIERCGMSYLSFDIASGYKTEILDLNRGNLPRRHRKAFDVVLNFGTTEHVLNQYNAFKLIHEATRTGGYMVHQLPVAGFTDHGYYVYTGRLFFELASYNGYEIVDLWYEGPVGEDDVYLSARAYASYYPALGRLNIPGAVGIPNFLLTLVYRQAANVPFAGTLETSTSVGVMPGTVRAAYASMSRKLKSEVRNSGIIRWHPRVLQLLRRLFGRRS